MRAHGARHSQRVSGAVFKVSDFEGVFKVSDFAPSKMRSVRFRVVCRVSGCEMSNFRNFEPSEIFEPSPTFATGHFAFRTFCRCETGHFAVSQVRNRTLRSFAGAKPDTPQVSPPDTPPPDTLRECLAAPLGGGIALGERVVLAQPDPSLSYSYPSDLEPSNCPYLG